MRSVISPLAEFQVDIGLTYLKESSVLTSVLHFTLAKSSNKQSVGLWNGILKCLS